MRRNATYAGILSLLLGSAAIILTAVSVANEIPSATGRSAAYASSSANRPASVPSTLKKRRVRLAAAAITPALPTANDYVPAVDLPTVSEKHKAIASAVLRALPSGCRDHLKNFAVLYKGATRRGLGGKTTIILDGTVPDTEFAALIVHECGHVISANLAGNAQSGDSGYRDGPEIYYKDSPMIAFWNLSWTAAGNRKADMKDHDFVSGYAKSDQYEDFAETLAAYALQRGMMAEHAKKSPVIAAKLAWMESNFPLQATAVGVGSATWTGTVPWDVTKLMLTLSY